jgi:hypothetical protein
MKPLFLAIALLSSQLFAQGNGRNYAPGFGANGRSYLAAAYDQSALIHTSANATYNGTASLTANNPNPALVLQTFTIDTGSVSVLEISGCGGTWAKFGATKTGNGNAKDGELWWSIPAVSGSCTITVTMTGAPSSYAGGIVYSLWGVNQFSPVSGFASATTGSLAITTSPGDTAISIDVDTTNNRTVTGCTSSTDLSAFGSFGYSSAHCPNATTSTFTWAAFGGTSMALGVDVQHQ